ncbi:MAG TPA: amidohydrolase family protein [Beijerinckiaceae bacterium]|jgi:aminocarboxymuconate-semialdehyde decarboxylase
MNRRELLASAVAAGACLACANRGAFAQPANSRPRRRIEIDGAPVRVVDVHCHCVVPEALGALKGTPMEGRFAGTLKSAFNNPPLETRIAAMDAQGVDIEVMSVNAFWYDADVELSRRLIDVQNEGLAKMCKASGGRLEAFATVALQHPELAAEQLEHATKHLGLKGAAIGGTVPGAELSDKKFDVFWAKAQELDALLFLHPQNSAVATGIADRVKGNGFLDNTIGNPLETTIAFSQMIFQGVFDRFPGLKICGAHGGGYLPSYADRSDAVCVTFPERCTPGTPQLAPSAYLRRNIFVDSLVFSAEALRHLAAVCGPGQIMVGTDYGFPWVKDPVGHVLGVAELSSQDKIAILGGNAAKLLKLA